MGSKSQKVKVTGNENVKTLRMPSSKGSIYVRPFYTYRRIHYFHQRKMLRFFVTKKTV